MPRQESHTYAVSSRKVTRPPRKKSTETENEYRARYQQWENERLSARSNSFRLVRPYPVSPLAKALHITIAQLSFARGEKYQGIELSQRTVAAMLGLKGRRARARAQEYLDELTSAGALVRLQEASGARGGIYVVSSPGLTPKLVANSGHNTESVADKATSPPPRTYIKEREKKERRGDDPSSPPAGAGVTPLRGRDERIAPDKAPLSEDHRSMLERLRGNAPPEAAGIIALLATADRQDRDRTRREPCYDYHEPSEHEVGVREQARLAREGKL